MCRPPGSATPFTLTPSQIPPTCSSPSAQMEEELTTMGFVDVYTLAEYVCRGSRICLHLSYPYGWTASYRNPDTDGWVSLLNGAPARPTYQEIEEALKAADVPFRFTEFDEIV